MNPMSAALTRLLHVVGRRSPEYGTYDWCESHGGHIFVNEIESFFCLRCWTGFFMGMSFTVDKEVQEGIIRGDTDLLGIAPGGALRHGHKWGSHSFVEGVKLISYVEALALGPNAKAHKDGGPPYVYELR